MRTTEEKARILRRIELFVMMPADDLRQIAAVVEQIEVAPGTTIVSKGAIGDCLYIVVDGLAQAHDGPLVFNQLHPHDVFGEMAVLDAETRSATVTALEPTTLFRLDQQSLYAFIHANPTLAIALIQSLSRRLRDRVHDRARDYAYIQQVGRITAAAQAVERGDFTPALLDEVVDRDDELGQLARMFRHMALEVRAREERLAQQVDELRIEIDEVRQAKKVAEITDSEYFQQLRRQADKLRSVMQGVDTSPA
jgi:CRP-like cAMP-binding protein